MHTKELTFTIMMGALGNVLFLISYLTGQIAPGVALDLSLIAVLIAGFFVGPRAGVIVGLIAGIVPGIMFGPAGNGGILGLVGLPIGKALTGLTSGLLAKEIKLYQKPRKSLLCAPLTLVAYIPEGIFTYIYFSLLLPLFTLSSPLSSVIINTIIIKAVAEVILMGFIISALMGNKGFNDFIRSYTQKTMMATPSGNYP